MAKSVSAAGKRGKSPTAKPQRGGKRSFVWLQGLICGAMVTLAPSLAIMLTFLLAPGLIALVLDRSPGRAVARGVLLFGLAAAVGPAKTLWEGGLAMPTAIQLMTDPLIFGTAWAAAAVGWLVGEVAPIVVEMVLTSSRKVRILKLEAARAKYAEEWGLNAENTEKSS
jgi:NAD/NADP transhydrogenase beta subunit